MLPLPLQPLASRFLLLRFRVRMRRARETDEFEEERPKKQATLGAFFRRPGRRRRQERLILPFENKDSVRFGAACFQGSSYFRPPPLYKARARASRATTSHTVPIETFPSANPVRVSSGIHEPKWKGFPNGRQRVVESGRRHEQSSEAALSTTSRSRLKLFQARIRQKSIPGCGNRRGKVS